MPRRDALRAIAAVLAEQYRPGAGIASQRVAHATIVSELRKLGLDSGTARVLADRSQLHDASPSTPLSPAMRMAHGQSPDTRAAYLVAAAQRLVDKTGLDRLDQQTRERRYLAQHVTAQTQREQAALKIDAAAAAYGPVLSWRSREDDRVTPVCRTAHGKNFRADKPPAIGWPGMIHAGRCRCVPGPVTNPRAPRLTTNTGGAVTEYARLDPHTVVVELARARRCRSIELAEGNKKTPGGVEVTKSGLAYDPKTKTFRPATQAEKDSAGKKGDFESKHPRAAAGSPSGGQFVPVGQARDDNAKKAQGDKTAQGDYKELLVGKGGPQDKKKGLATLDDRRLQALSRVLYSFKTSDPRVVQARTLVAGELARRGQDVKQYGALGGGPAQKKPAKKKPVKLSRPAFSDGAFQRALELSANTARYSTTSTPLGKGDLFNTPGVGLPDYVRNIARSIMRESGRSKSQAIALAIGAVKRWARGGGDVSPEVRDAAVKAVAQWEAAKAKARATPNKSDLSRTADTGIELTRHVRSPAGVKRYGKPIGAPLGKGGPSIPRGVSENGQRHANRVTRIDGMRQRRAYAAALSDEDLADADRELSRRAALLGKPGVVAGQHRAIRDEIAKRGTKPTAQPKPTAGAPRKRETQPRHEAPTAQPDPERSEPTPRPTAKAGRKKQPSSPAAGQPTNPPARRQTPALTQMSEKDLRRILKAAQDRPSKTSVVRALIERVTALLARRRSAPTDLSTVGVDAVELAADSGHDLIFYSSRSTPQVVTRGAPVPDPIPTGYGRFVKRRAATAVEEKTIAAGRWVRVDPSGRTPADPAYKRSRLRPQLAEQAMDLARQAGSVPVSSALDGPRTTRSVSSKGAARMAGTNPFGAKKAPPFTKSTTAGVAAPPGGAAKKARPNPFAKGAATPAATPAEPGKNSGDGPAAIKKLVAAYAVVPDDQRDAYRRRVIDKARAAGAMALIPGAWLKGKPGVPAGAGGNAAAGRSPK